MSLSTAPTGRARQEAAEWFTRLNRLDVPEADLRAFGRWRRGPGHKEAYDEVDALWRSSGRLTTDTDIQNLMGGALRRLKSQPTPGRTRPWRPIAGAAFSAALVIALGVGGYLVLRPEAYSTSIGEQRLVRLRDGSTIKLDTQTKIVVHYSKGRRDLNLEHGQALFEVAHDATRPFVVHAGVTTVTALGTKFDVRRDADGAKVTLVQGSVEVRRSTPTASQSWRLKPGQALATQKAGAAPRAVDVSVATSWSTGRLVFQAVPLGDAIAEVNRYSRDKVVLDVPELASEPISGVFDTGDTETFVGSVADFHDLVADRSKAGEVRLAQASGPEQHR